MKKLAVVNDLHFGVRNGCELHRRALLEFFDEVFFPAVKEAGVELVIFNGDTFDQRRSLTPIAMADAVSVVRRIVDSGMEVIMPVGNHDIYYNSRLDVNSIRPLFGKMDGVLVIDDGVHIRNFGDVKIAVVPWLVKGVNEEAAFEVLNKEKPDFAFTHLDVRGGRVSAGVFMDGGYVPDVFSEVGKVINGHIHVHSEVGNVIIPGTQYQMTINDIGERKRFLIVGDDGSVVPVYNDNNLYYENEIPDNPEGKIIIVRGDALSEEEINEAMQAGAQVRLLRSVRKERDADDVAIDEISSIDEMVREYILNEYEGAMAKAMLKAYEYYVGSALK